MLLSLLYLQAVLNLSKPNANLYHQQIIIIKIYKINNLRPSTEPYGTPQVNFDISDIICLYILMSVIHIAFVAMWMMPLIIYHSSFLRSTQWSIVRKVFFVLFFRSKYPDVGLLIIYCSDNIVSQYHHCYWGGPICSKIVLLVTHLKAFFCLFVLYISRKHPNLFGIRTFY